MAELVEESTVISENERDFAEKFPHLFKKYLLFRKYYQLKTGNDFYGDDYDAILIKSLVAYFLYKGKNDNRFSKSNPRVSRVPRVKKPKLTLKELAILLKYKSHTGTVYAIQSIRRMLKYNPDYKVLNKEIKDLWLSFNFIMTKN